MLLMICGSFFLFFKKRCTCLPGCKESARICHKGELLVKRFYSWKAHGLISLLLFNHFQLHSLPKSVERCRRIRFVFSPLMKQPQAMSVALAEADFACGNAKVEGRMSRLNLSKRSGKVVLERAEGVSSCLRERLTFFAAGV